MNYLRIQKGKKEPDIKVIHKAGLKCNTSSHFSYFPRLRIWWNSLKSYTGTIEFLSNLLLVPLGLTAFLGLNSSWFIYLFLFSFFAVHALNKLSYAKLDSKSVGIRQGVIFLTYSCLIASSERGRSRLQQLVQWCGIKYDGLVIFDEVIVLVLACNGWIAMTLIVVQAYHSYFLKSCHGWCKIWSYFSPIKKNKCSDFSLS